MGRTKQTQPLKHTPFTGGALKRVTQQVIASSQDTDSEPGTPATQTQTQPHAGQPKVRLTVKKGPYQAANTVSRPHQGFKSVPSAVQPGQRGMKSVPVQRLPVAQPARVNKRKQGVAALRQIKIYQKSTDLLIPLRPFVRLVREITQEIDKRQVISAWSKEGMLAIQDATEAFVVELLDSANLAAIHAKRVTLMCKDVRLALRLRSETASMP